MFPRTLRILLFLLGTTSALLNAQCAQRYSAQRCRAQRTTVVLRSRDKDRSLVDRFLNPVVDDPGLILADAQISGIILPGIEAIVFFAAGARPSWLGPPGTSLFAPTISHGCGLALCWLCGALSARAYEEAAYSKTDVAISRTLAGGSFAVGLLILATQARLALSGFAGISDPGLVVDQNLIEQIQAASDLILDVAFEATGLLAWRIYRTSLTGKF
jgi:hypothetical protein